MSWEANFSTKIEDEVSPLISFMFSCPFVQFCYLRNIYSFQFNSVTKLWLIVLKLDIHCVSSNGYIASFSLLWISIVLCAKHEYIGSFELNWICIVFFVNKNGFIESFNRNNRTCIGFNCLSNVWTKHENVYFDLWGGF